MLLKSAPKSMLLLSQKHSMLFCTYASGGFVISTFPNKLLKLKVLFSTYAISIFEKMYLCLLMLSEMSDLPTPGWQLIIIYLNQEDRGLRVALLARWQWRTLVNHGSPRDGNRIKATTNVVKLHSYSKRSSIKQLRYSASQYFDLLVDLTNPYRYIDSQTQQNYQL